MALDKTQPYATIETADGRSFFLQTGTFYDIFGNVVSSIPGYTVSGGSRALSGGGIGLQAPGVLAQSAVASSVTGTLTETTLATIAIPAGAMGPNGSLRVKTKWTLTNNANSKSLYIRLGGTQLGLQQNANNATTFAGDSLIQNRNATNSQLGSSGPGVSTSFVFATGAVDTTVAQNLTISCQLGVGTDTGTLESYLVELLNL